MVLIQLYILHQNTILCMQHAISNNMVSDIDLNNLIANIHTYTRNTQYNDGLKELVCSKTSYIIVDFCVYKENYHVLQ